MHQGKTRAGRRAGFVGFVVSAALVVGFVGAPAAAAADAAPAMAPAASVEGLPRLVRVLKSLPAGETGPRHEVALDREAARKAVEAGQLRIDLPDGRAYAAAVVDQQAHPTGDWSLVAEVATAFGPQRAVFTFGADASFALLPTPSGELLRVVTDGGRRVIEPDGPIFPVRDGRAAPAHADHVVPVPPKAGSATAVRLDDAAALGFAKAGEVVIDVLGLYTTELVNRRGSTAAVETEFTHLLTIGNEAYAASGANVRFQFVGFRQTNYPVGAAYDNDVALGDIRTNALPDLDLHAARDALRADLVAMLRSYPDGDSCGIAYLNGGGRNAENLDSAFGYSVNNVGPCGVYTLAHELGHNLGSTHDRAASDFGSGAYLYSHGYRQSFSPPFATVMAYNQGLEARLGQFSRPEAACLGAPCGVAEQSDNVRSLLLMAPRVALFRQPAGLLDLLDAVALESRVSNTSMGFRVRLSSPAPAGGVTVQYSTSNLTATSGLDYNATSGSLTIPAGQTQGTIFVTVLADTALEGDETLRLTLTSVTGSGVTAGRTVATGRIREPVMSIEDIVLTEGDSGTQQGTVTVRLSDATSVPVGFSLATANGTATAGSDYVAVSLAGQSLPAGTVEASFPFTVNGDTLAEADETFDFVLSGVTGVTVADDRARVTIVDNDTPKLSFIWGRVQAREFDSGQRTYSIPVTLSRAAAGVVSFNVTSADLDATAGVDYAPVNSIGVVIPPGQTQANIPLTVYGDTEPEADEVLLMNIGNLSGAAIGQGRLEFVIRTDEGPQAAPRLVVNDLNVIEGAAGNTSADLAIFLDKPVATDTTLTATVTAGTATAGVDYVVPSPLTVLIPAGQAGAVFSVPVVGDTANEPDETFTVAFTGPSSILYDDASAVVTILNDDTPGPAYTVRGDRFVLRENQGQVAMSVLANDEIGPGAVAGGSLRIGYAPTLGTASVQTQGTADPTDDVILYTPAANTSGEESFGYDLCTAGNQCRTGWVQVVLRPRLDVELETAGHAGFSDLALTGLRPLPAARFQATALVEPKRFQPALAADATPASPWDNGKAGTWTTVETLAAAGDGQPQEWRVLAEAAGLGANVDLYLGLDSNGNSAADPEELACTAAMTGTTERCELTVQVPGDGPARYWVMVHNRGASAQSANAFVFEVPQRVGNGRLSATGPGGLAAGAAFAVRAGWNDPGMVQGDRRVGYVRVSSQGGHVGAFPVHLTRTGAESSAMPLSSGVQRTLRLGAGQAQERMFIDVPAGATSLDVTVTGDQDVNLYLAPVASPAGPGIAPAPARGLAVASATGPGTSEGLTVTGGTLQPGRWYVTPVNAGAVAANVTVLATVTANAPVVRPGSYYNAARSGHGLFLYPAGPARVGLWYTYLQDGTPTWYYLQGTTPGANGLWTATLYRSAWLGDTNVLTAVGEARMAPTGPDAFTFTYTLDGETGAEPMAALGRGCPTLSGQPLDVSSHWYNPARAGSGYSVQMFGNYEFHAAFVYDGQGVPRFLLAERNGFGGAQADLVLAQLQGFCPLCERTGNPTRSTVGVFSRGFADGSFSGVQVDAIYGAGLPGAWTADEVILPLGGASSRQGCEP